MPIAPPRRRRLRLSLRLMMLAVVVAAIPLARIAVRARAQRAAVRTIREAGGGVSYDWQLTRAGRYNPSAEGPPGPRWLIGLLGSDYFETVKNVDLQNEEMGDELMVYVGRFTGLRRLSISGTKITDAGMVHVASLHRLTNVYLQWDTNLTGASLA